MSTRATSPVAVNAPGPSDKAVHARRTANDPEPSSRAGSKAILVGGLLLAALIASYWRVLTALFRDWQNDQNYSVGQLVPLAALYLLYHDRAKLRRCTLRPSAFGLLLIALAVAARAFGLFYLYESAERYSFVIMLAGTVLLVAGWDVFKRVAWILVFLLLMVPLPGRIHNLVSSPLQTYAASGAVFVLELLGVIVTREGNTMLLNNSVPVAVAEGCSGLRMLTAFVVVSFVLAYVVGRPGWQKALLVASSIPIAIVCNLVRLVATALLFLVVSSKAAETFFHDFAGLTMMPLAVLLLAGELWLMHRLVTPDVPNAGAKASAPPARETRPASGR